MHFIQKNKNKNKNKESTADLFHPGSPVFKNHNLLYSNSKLSQNKMINRKIVTSKKAVLPFVSLDNFTSARASFT